MSCPAGLISILVVAVKLIVEALDNDYLSPAVPFVVI